MTFTVDYFNSQVGSFSLSFSFSFSCSSFSLFTCCNKKVSIDLHIPQRKYSQLTAVSLLIYDVLW